MTVTSTQERRRRKHFDPQGTAEFVAALKEASVPKTVVGHKERWFSPKRLGKRSDYAPQTSPKGHGKRLAYSPSPHSSPEFGTPTKGKSPGEFKTPTTSKGQQPTLDTRFTKSSSKSFTWAKGKKLTFAQLSI